MYRSVGVALIALFLTNAYAAKDAQRTVKVNGCEIYMSAQAYEPGRMLVVRPTDDPLEDALLNKAIEITKTDFAPVYETNRELQRARAREVAQSIAAQILAPELLGNAKGQMKIQDILTTQLGVLPDGAMASIENIMDVNLAEIGDAKLRPAVRVKTDNALSDLTAKVTKYRKHAFDVNAVANLGNRLATIPVLNKLPIAKELPELFRQRFQSVIGAIRSVLSVFTDALAHMRMRQEQMGIAVLDADVLGRYLELSQYIGEEVRDIVTKHMDENQMSKEQKATFTRIVVQPVNTRLEAIMDDEATMMGFKFQMVLLMDGNLDLIGFIGNIRQTAAIKLKTYAVGKILMGEMERTKNLVRDYYAASHELSVELVNQIRAQGISIRDTREMIIQTSADMLDVTGQLLAEMKVASEAPVTTNEKLVVANRKFARQLELMRAEGSKYDLIAATQKITDELVPESRRGNAIHVIPDVPEVIPQ